VAMSCSPPRLMERRHNLWDVLAISNACWINARSVLKSGRGRAVKIWGVLGVSSLGPSLTYSVGDPFYDQVAFVDVEGVRFYAGYYLAFALYHDIVGSVGQGYCLDPSCLDEECI
jgi:hypothetical protein